MEPLMADLHFLAFPGENILFGAAVGSPRMFCRLRE
jgi:hypothetical protein